MRKTRRRKDRPSKEQVRAWLTTVITPLASALAVEQHRTASRNWSFRCETQDFEFLWPVEKMVGVPYSANLHQLLRYRSELKRLADGHDRKLDDLRSAARLACDRVLRNERFRRLASSSGVSDPDQRHFAEYVVNGLRGLASYHTFHEYWGREGERFLSLREDPSLVSEFRALEENGRSFSKSVNELTTVVESLQIELADAYKLPPIEAVDAPV